MEDEHYIDEKGLEALKWTFVILVFVMYVRATIKLPQPNASNLL